MNIKIQTPGFKPKEDLTDFVNEKVQKLSRFSDRIISCEVTLKTDNNGPGKEKTCSIRVAVPGNDLLATSQCATFEEAILAAVETAERQLKKRKNKLQDKNRKETGE